MFVKRYPELKEKIDKIVSNFIENERYQVKTIVPNLGAFLAMLSVSSYKWKDVKEAYLQESMVRNVRWLLEKNPELAKLVPDPEIDKYRIAKSFHALINSLKTTCFHIYFLELLEGKSLDEWAEECDQTYGIPRNTLKDSFLESVKKIKGLQNWEDFYTRAGIPCPTESVLLDKLRKVIQISTQRKYHKPDDSKKRSPSTSSSESDYDCPSPSSPLARSTISVPSHSFIGGIGRGQPLAASARGRGLGTVGTSQSAPALVPGEGWCAPRTRSPKVTATAPPTTTSSSNNNNNNNRGNRSNNGNNSSNNNSNSKQGICRLNLKGCCNRGANCRFNH